MYLVWFKSYFYACVVNLRGLFIFIDYSRVKGCGGTRLDKEHVKSKENLYSITAVIA